MLVFYLKTVLGLFTFAWVISLPESFYLSHLLSSLSRCTWVIFRCLSHFTGSQVSTSLGNQNTVSHIRCLSRFTWVIFSPWVLLPESFFGSWVVLPDVRSALNNPNAEMHFRSNYRLLLNCFTKKMLWFLASNALNGCRRSHYVSLLSISAIFAWSNLVHSSSSSYRSKKVHFSRF